MDFSSSERDYSEEEVEKMPRRLRRFYRQDASSEGAIGKVSSFIEERKEDSIANDLAKNVGKVGAVDVARREVRRFREEHDRLPEKNDYSSMIDSIFEQMKHDNTKEDEINDTFASLKRTLGIEKVKVSDKKGLGHESRGSRSEKNLDKSEKQEDRVNRRDLRRDRVKSGRNKGKNEEENEEDAFSLDEPNLNDTSLGNDMGSEQGNEAFEGVEGESDLGLNEDEFALDPSLMNEGNKKKKKK